jgi:uncharacterized delta-60 repeat protein
MHFVPALAFGLSSTAFPGVAADGVHDLSFGVDPGITTLSFAQTDQGDDDLARVLTDPSGKLYLVGTTRNSGRRAYTVTRLLADGAPDASYKNGGVLISTPPGESRDFTATSSALQPDGKLIVAGYVQIEANDGDRDLMVCRFTPGGDLDPGFGSATVLGYAGCEQYAFASGGNAWDMPLDMLVQPNGRIVIAGLTTRPGNRHSGLFLRLLSDGKLDTSFYGLDAVADGWSAYPAIDSPDSGGIKFSALTRQADGSLIIGAYAGGEGGEIDDAVLTKNVIIVAAADGVFAGAAGGLDFGAGAAKLRTQLTDVVSETGDTIIAVGSQETSPGRFLGGIAKYSLPGFALDKTFSGDGLVAYEFCELCSDTRLMSAALQQDGKLLVGGVIKTDRYRSFVARILPTGSFDQSFGSGGVAHIDLQTAAGDESLRSITLQAGRSVLAGRAFKSAGDGAFAVARLSNDGIFASDLE